MCVAVPLMFAVASAATGAYGSYQTAKGQKNMANYQAQVANNNAIVAEYQAQDARARGDEEASAARRRGDQIKGQQRVAFAGAGVDISSGTAQELQDQTDFFSLADQNTARNNAAKDVWAKRAQVQNFQSEGAMQRATANSISPGGAAFTSLLSRAGQVAGKWYPPGAEG